VTQEVLVKVSQALKDFRNEASLSTWIYRIATNAALDKLRGRDFTRIHEGLPEDGDVTEIVDRNTWSGSETPPVDRQLIRREMNECIVRVIDSLPEDYRAVIVLGELEEFGNREISEILGISIDNVKIRLHRARAQLKKSLEDRCSFYRDERNEFACDLKSASGELRTRQ
jgi:RNA polymerase sigma-70 factor (ECF subfamily)